MKCPQCNERTGSKYVAETCKSCGYRWVLDRTDGMSDSKFLSIVRSTSRNGSCYFTRNQLFAEVIRKTEFQVFWPMVLMGCCFIGVSLFAVWVIQFDLRWPGPLALLGAALMWCWFLLMRKFAAAADPAHYNVNGLIAKFQKSRPETLEKLIVQPRLDQCPPDWPERDIYDYGVERILIVERDELVDLMVLNNIHSEQKTLVVAESGYPHYLTAKVQALLTAQPDLPVFLLHDSTAHGEAMQQRLLKSPHWPLDGRALVDLGLHPSDVKGMKRMQPLKPERRNYEIPVDFLLIHTLSAGVALAMSRHCPLSQLMLPSGSPAGSAFDHSSGEAAGDGEFG